MENRTEKTKLKRFLAFVFDLIFIILLSFTTVGILGLFIKIDSNVFPMLMLFLITTIVLVYLLFGELILRNTLGKYLMGIEIVDKESNKRPTTLSFIKRGLLKIIWPLEGLILLLSKTKNRLGDLWSKSIVVNKESNQFNLSVRIIIGIISMVVVFFSFIISLKFATKNSDFYSFGKFYLNSVSGLEINGLPSTVNQNRQLVNFTVPIKDQNHNRYALIYLEKKDGKWDVYYCEYIKNSIIIGFEYSYNPSTVTIKDYYSDGTLQSEGALIDNKKEGTWKWYNENGQLKESSVWHNDQQIISKP